MNDKTTLVVLPFIGQHGSKAVQRPYKRARARGGLRHVVRITLGRVASWHYIALYGRRLSSVKLNRYFLCVQIESILNTVQFYISR